MTSPRATGPNPPPPGRLLCAPTSRPLSSPGASQPPSTSHSGLPSHPAARLVHAPTAVMLRSGLSQTQALDPCRVLFLPASSLRAREIVQDGSHPRDPLIHHGSRPHNVMLAPTGAARRRGHSWLGDVESRNLDRNLSPRAWHNASRFLAKSEAAIAPGRTASNRSPCDRLLRRLKLDAAPWH